VPGLDRVIPSGIREGSLIVIVGPPGSGKTLLALQLLMEMHADGEKAPKSLFLTADEDNRVLESESRKILPSLNDADHIGLYPDILHARSQIKNAFRELFPGAAGEFGGDIGTAVDLVHTDDERMALRRKAVELLTETTADNFEHSDYGAIALDGALNLQELRGETPSERRNAFFELSQILRTVVRGVSVDHTAAILTIEASKAGDVEWVEEYLADVVIQLRVQAPTKDKRRRILEVTKARYANPVLGEHSFWIMGDTEVRRRRTANADLGWSKLTLDQTIRRGIVVFPRIRWRADKSHKPAPTQFCTFGTPGLDVLVGADAAGSTGQGVPRFSSTAIVGGPGTGKSTIAYLFALAGLSKGENVVFISFDVQPQRIRQQAGRFCLGGRNDAPTKAFGDFMSRGAEPQLKLIYEHPVNIDLNELLHFVYVEVKNLTATNPNCRVILDGISELDRNMADPLVFNNFIVTLINSAHDWGVTLLLTYEDGSIRERESTDSTVVRLADNAIALRHVPVNNANRKCISIQKVRGLQHSSAIAEMTYWNKGDASGVTVRKGFEGMSKVLTGSPQPAQIELRLFYENEQERTCNQHFYEDAIERFGDRVRHIPYTLSGARRTYWHRQEGRDIRPDADVTIVALDEPWIQAFLDSARSDGTSLAWFDPRYADVGQRFLVGQLMPALRLHACESRPPTAETRMLALPHYVDLGLLLKRTDYELPDMPTYWVSDVGDRHDSSFERIVTEASRRLGVPGFAFDMESSETTSCTFLEMCWNFGASPAFLNDQSDRDLDAAVEALAFLARLRWTRVLPFPCTLEHCSSAIFCRAWYANVATLAKCSGGKTWRPVPFYTFRRAPIITPIAGTAVASTVDQARANVITPGTHVPAGATAPLAGITPPAAPSTGADGVSPDNAYVEFLFRQQEAWDKECGSASEKLRQTEERVRGSKIGVSCSGAWYLGVVTTGGNASIGWSVVQEALNPRRVEERAFFGGGLPPTVPFYHTHGERPVPFLADTSFRLLTQSLLRWTQHRESALGLPQHRNADQASQEMPEMVHHLLMTVLCNPLSDGSATTNSRQFIREQVQALFHQIRILTAAGETSVAAAPPQPDLAVQTVVPVPAVP